MKLDTDCIRDLLLTLEEESKYDEGQITKRIFLHKMTQFPRMQKYEVNDVLYTSDKMVEAGFIDFHKTTASGGLYNSSYGQITYSGHQFLENIRSDNNWNKTKEIAKSIGATSLSAISDIAAKVIAELISKRMGLS